MDLDDDETHCRECGLMETPFGPLAECDGCGFFLCPDCEDEHRCPDWRDEH